MTIDEAIEILQPRDTKRPHITLEEWEQAVKLGIEALKGIKKVRKTFEPYVTALLPGETEK